MSENKDFQNGKKGFHLVSVETAGQSIPLFTDEKFGKGPKASIVIGPNGSGKSRALATILDQFIYFQGRIEKLEEQPKEQTTLSFSSRSPHDTRLQEADVRLRYFLNGSFIEVCRVGQQIFAFQNGEERGLHNLPFPRRVLALAHMPYDKFRFSRNRRGDFYKYLGIRQSSNMTTTGALETYVALSCAGLVHNPKKLQAFERWLSEVRLHGPISIEARLRRSVLDHLSDAEALRHYVIERAPRGPLGRRAETNNDLETYEVIERLWELIDYGLNSRIDQEKEGTKAIPSIELPREILDQPFNGGHSISELLHFGRNNGVFLGLNMTLGRDGASFHFSELSSGEQHLLSAVAKLLAELEDNSLVLIDEPEVSLHPTWQRKYLPLLLETLEAFPNTHVVLATHSHFIVSDVDTEIASLTVGSDRPEHGFKSYEQDVYGRSAENILYRVFGVATASNHYLGQDLETALRMLSRTTELDIEQLKEI